MNSNIQKLLGLIVKLPEGSKPLWGKMSTQHMIEHLILAFRFSNGKMKIECFNPPDKLPTLKRFLMSNRELPKNFINPTIGENLIPLEFKNLDEAVAQLRIEINNYYKYFEEAPNAEPINPTFGKLNKTEWEHFHTKHMTHHLKQFGLL